MCSWASIQITRNYWEERGFAVIYTRFHVDAIDPSVFGEETLQIGLASLVLEVTAENRLHLLRNCYQKT